MFKSLLLLLTLLFTTGIAVADVPPDPGSTRQPANLILETDGDLSAYRFFLDSPMRVEEVKVTGNRIVIEAANRDGAMRSAKLIAVPLSDMSVISGDLSGSLIEFLIRQNKFPNAKELISHNFQQTISIVEKPLWQDPVYRISVENGEISASKLSGGSESGVVSLSTEYLWPIVIVSGAVALMLTMALIVFGVWLFRRKKKKV